MLRAGEAAHVQADLGEDDLRGDRSDSGDGLKAYAGASPVTRASGKKSSITHRWVKNDRPNHAGYLWAFSAITASPGAKTHYRRRRDDAGDWHAAAQRNLFNRMLGQLYHCLKNRRLFDEHTAFPTALIVAA
ncbi:transposase [Kitasatospora sp. NPDC059146]|uniref:transposase n=1 Tax=Kitasatospora sp. NPDC059146 TaxID=3346741 RepID=UPI00369AB699